MVFFRMFVKTQQKCSGSNIPEHFLMVEPRGIEPLSENNLEGTSPGAVCYLHSLIRTGTNTLPDLVAS